MKMLLSSSLLTGHKTGLRIDSGSDILQDLRVRSYVMNWLAIDKSQ